MEPHCVRCTKPNSLNKSLSALVVLMYVYRSWSRTTCAASSPTP